MRVRKSVYLSEINIFSNSTLVSKFAIEYFFAKYNDGEEKCLSQ